MSAKKEDIAASLHRESRRQSAAVTPQPAVPTAAVSAATPSARKVRMTVDLVTQEFRDFRRWREDTAEELGLAKISVQDVLRLLVRRLLDDKELQTEIVAALRREGRQ